MNMNDIARDEAWRFLREFEVRLIDDLRRSEQLKGKSIAKQISEIRVGAGTDESKTHLNAPEAAFLNTWVVKALRQQLLAFDMSPEDARAALLAESHAALTDITGGPAARPAAYPFTKAMNTRTRAIYDRWALRKGKTMFPTTWPDLALQAPHRVVFEGKYFSSGSLDVAERQLVTAIHEALFYLGVPAIRANNRIWGYEYACLVAFDASDEQTLMSAWSYLQAQEEFWNKANLYVVVAGFSSQQGMNVSAYEEMFRKLGFTSFDSHKKLQHPNLKPTLYFNRSRSGVVSFAVYAKDRERFDRKLWNFIPAQQKKDEDPTLRTVVPRSGKERQAFQALLAP